MTKLSFSRFTPSGAKQTLHVFGHGLLESNLDTLEHAFGCFQRLFPARTAKKQANIAANLIRQENNIPDEDWQKRRDKLSDEHKHGPSMLRPARSLSTDGNSGLARNR